MLKNSKFAHKKVEFLSKSKGYPLIWPEHWPITREAERLPAKDKVTHYLVAKDYTLKELYGLGATNVLISANLPLNSDGEPFLDYAERAVDEPGVAVYFFYAEKAYVMACDAWQFPKDNLRSIGVAIGHIRSTAKTVAPYYLEKMLSAFLIDDSENIAEKNQATRTPHGHQAEEDSDNGTEKSNFNKDANPAEWWKILGVEPDASLTEIESAFRMLARKNHPDRGGNAQNMQIISQAIAFARDDNKRSQSKKKALF